MCGRTTQFFGLPTQSLLTCIVNKNKMPGSIVVRSISCGWPYNYIEVPVFIFYFKILK